MQVGSKVRKLSGRKFHSGKYVEVICRVEHDKAFISDGSWVLISVITLA